MKRKLFLFLIFSLSLITTNSYCFPFRKISSVGIGLASSMMILFVTNRLFDFFSTDEENITGDNVTIDVYLLYQLVYLIYVNYLSYLLFKNKTQSYILRTIGIGVGSLLTFSL